MTRVGRLLSSATARSASRAVLLLLTVASLGTAACEAANSPRRIARRAQRGVFLVEAKDEKGDEIGVGTAFLIADTLAATSLHVIEGSWAATLREVSGAAIRVQVTGFAALDRDNDLVLLHLASPLGEPLELGSLSDVEPGDTVFAFGNPAGLAGSFSQGVVSAVRDGKVLQITAPISRGSSGSPVLSAQGRVVGIVFGALEAGQNLNLATSVEALKRLVPLSARSRPLPFAVEGNGRDRERLGLRGLVRSVKTTKTVESQQPQRPLPGGWWEITVWPDLDAPFYGCSLGRESVEFDLAGRLLTCESAVARESLEWDRRQRFPLSAQRVPKVTDDGRVSRCNYSQQPSRRQLAVRCLPAESLGRNAADWLFDVTGRIVQETAHDLIEGRVNPRGGGRTIDYQYDPAGCLSRRVKAGQPDVAVCDDRANPLRVASGTLGTGHRITCNYVYDSGGNWTSRECEAIASDKGSVVDAEVWIEKRALDYFKP